MFRVILLVTVLALSLGACTHRQAFESLKANKRNDCYRQPPPTQDQCLQEVQDLDYQSYKRQRDEILEEEAN